MHRVALCFLKSTRRLDEYTAITIGEATLRPCGEREVFQPHTLGHRRHKICNGAGRPASEYTIEQTLASQTPAGLPWVT